MIVAAGERWEMDVRAGSVNGAEFDAASVVDLTGVEPVVTRQGANSVHSMPSRAERWSETFPTVSVIIPTLNEERNLPHVLPKIPTWVTEVVIVDGRSTDRTVEVALDLMPKAVIVEQDGTGKGDAMRAGFEASSGEVLIAIDADGSMNPEEMYAYVGQLVAGSDLVKGSRFTQGGGTVDMELHRRAGNRLLVWFTRLLYGQKFSDLCYGYIAFWRDSLEVLQPDRDGFEIEALICARALRGGLKIAEVPSFEECRLNGSSNLRTFRDGWRVLRTLVSVRARRTPA